MTKELKELAVVMSVIYALMLSGALAMSVIGGVHEPIIAVALIGATIATALGTSWAHRKWFS